MWFKKRKKQQDEAPATPPNSAETIVTSPTTTRKNLPFSSTTSVENEEHLQPKNKNAALQRMPSDKISKPKGFQRVKTETSLSMANDAVMSDEQLMQEFEKFLDEKNITGIFCKC